MTFFGDNYDMEQGISRRGFMCAALATAAGVAISSPSAEAAGAIKVLRDGRVEVNLSKFKALGKIGGAILVGNVKSVPTALVRTGKNSYQGLDLRCTHQGVTSKLVSGSFKCPAHGSEFTKTGAVKIGPAQSGLNKVNTEVSGKTVILG
jgi:cytochrome b6-f complex iron-sulfur subunit